MWLPRCAFDAVKSLVIPSVFITSLSPEVSGFDNTFMRADDRLATVVDDSQMNSLGPYRVKFVFAYCVLS